MTDNSTMTSTLISVAVVALIVLRFAFSELRDRVVRARSLWVRPGLFAALTLLFAYEALARPEAAPLLLVVALAVAIVLGLIVGALIIRFTTFQPAPLATQPAVRAQGSWQTLVVWVVAIALRFSGRLLIRGEGAAEQLALNAALFALMAAAFVFIAWRFQRAIRAYRPAG
jgi:hypothetical protein